MNAPEPPRQNLPLPPTPLVGRVRELEAVRLRLWPPGAVTGAHGTGTSPAIPRLLTLTGPPGIGKTRLALAAADTLVDVYADGAWLVELAPLVDPALVPQAVASAIGVQEAPEQPLLETLASYLRANRLLLLLDNCEHLVQACAEMVDALLRACPGLTVLATSREALGIEAEHTWPVPPLALPPSDAVGSGRPAPDGPDGPEAHSHDRLMQFEAVQLFVARAAAVTPSFTLTEANAPAVAEICRRLDGIPLALELAASRVRALSVTQIAARLGDRFGLLTAGSRTALPRHQTLRALVAWSYDLLPKGQQALFAQLSVFAGGFTLEAAEAVAAAAPIAGDAGPAGAEPAPQGPAHDVLDGLAQLVDKSLVLADVRDGANEGVRYRLLETLREYGAQRLDNRGAPGNEADTRERHAAYYLALAEDSRVPLQRAEQLEWLARLDREHDNMRAALRWWLDRGQAGDAEALEHGLRLAGALGWPYWSLRAHHMEGREWLSRLLALSPGRRTIGRARALLASGQLGFALPDWRPLAAWLEESATLGLALGDTWTTAYALASLGIVMQRTDSTVARDRFDEALALFCELGDSQGVGYCLRFIGVLHQQAGDLDAALEAYARSLEAARISGERWTISISLRELGQLAMTRGDIGLARTLVTQALSLTRELGIHRGTGLTLLTLGEVSLAAGAPREAVALYREAAELTRYNTVGYDTRVLAHLAMATLALGDPARAVCLAGAAVARSEAGGVPPPEDAQTKIERIRELGGQALGSTAFAAAWAQGRALTVDEAIDYGLAAEAARAMTESALGETPPPTGAAAAAVTRREPAAERWRDLLSARERQVAALVARGYSNPQIAAALTVTRATAARHVEHILAKLGLRNRAQITAWAVEHGLLAADRD